MRSLLLALRNINSLRGDHVVDFTDPTLAGVDLFGITGPTGSGKSTLLDAITLALYGRVVRHGGNTSPEPAVSTHTADASAVYRFAVQGMVHEARWSIRRSRGRLDGAFQPVVRELLVQTDTGIFESVAEGNARVNAAVEQLLGLGFEQFQRVALLPQGEFDRFLTANENERAGILEKLTGTGPYHAFGNRIHEKWVFARSELDGIRNWMGGVEATLLSEDIRRDKETQRQHWHAEHENLAARARHLSGRFHQASQLATALEEQAECARERENVLQEIATAEPEIARVRRWRALEPAYDAQKRQNVAMAAEQAARERARQAALGVDSAASAWAVLHAQALDFGMRQAAQDLEDARTIALRHGMDAPRTLGDAVAVAEALGGKLQRILDTLSPCLAALDQRESAASKYWGRLRGATGSPAQASEFADAPPNDARRLALFAQAFGWAQAQLPATGAVAEQCKRTAESAIAAATGARTIAQLKIQLRDGGRCGVCGSDVAPGTVTDIPSLEQLTESAERAKEALEKALKTAEGVRRWFDDVVSKRDDWEGAARQADLARTTFEESFRHVGLEPLPADLETQSTLQQSIALLGRVQLRARQSTWLDILAKDAPNRGAQDEWVPRDWTSVESAAQAVERAKAEWRTARELRVAADTAARSAETALSDADTHRANVWQALGIVDDKQLESFRMEPDVAARLENEDRARTDRVSHLAGRAAACAETCSKLRAILPSLPEDVSGRESLANDVEAALTAANDALSRETALATELADDARHRERITERMAELANWEVRERRWRFLRDHFGKDRLTRKVQELTMGALVGYANLRLSGFTHRYELVCDSDRPLEIRVRDRSRLDALRPTAGLSGGEKFLVSLSLALGLSDIAGRSSRIESLFIDEGFGTLDAATLETALATLQQLRIESGRQVGIISHVGALQERLSARIRVVPRGDGSSTVQIEG